MEEEDKRTMTTRLEERILDAQNLTNTQMDLMNKIMTTNHKLNHKDVEIADLKTHNEILKNELKNENESMEKFNKPQEVMKYFEELMKSSSYHNGSRCSCIEKGESSRNGEMINTKSKDKSTCYHCGKIGHTANIF